MCVPRRLTRNFSSRVTRHQTASTGAPRALLARSVDDPERIIRASNAGRRQERARLADISRRGRDRERRNRRVRRRRSESKARSHSAPPASAGPFDRLLRPAASAINPRPVAVGSNLDRNPAWRRSLSVPAASRSTSSTATLVTGSSWYSLNPRGPSVATGKSTVVTQAGVDLTKAAETGLTDTSSEKRSGRPPETCSSDRPQKRSRPDDDDADGTNPGVAGPNPVRLFISF